MLSVGHKWSRTAGRRRTAGALLLVVAAGVAACGSGGTSHPGAIKEQLRDFEIQSAVTQVKPGQVTFEVINNGPSTHEFIVDRTDLAPNGLPIDSTGLRVNEESAQLENQGEVSSLLRGSKEFLTLNLKPGHYVLFCNLEGHYLETMHVAFVVG
jgi:uncharacterized cupredoxin-like copper-binding protein